MGRRCSPPIHPSPAASAGLCYAESRPNFAAGGTDKAGNAEQKNRGGRGRGVGRQRLLPTAALPCTAPEDEGREMLGETWGAM